MELTDKDAERFWSKVNMLTDTGCLEWCGGKDRDGYGVIKIQGKVLRANRVSFMTMVGPIPHNHEVDHRCRNRACVNPFWCLESVTHVENVRRSQVNNRERQKTHCPKGHPYSGDNLIIRPNGHRRCRTCKNTKSIKWE